MNPNYNKLICISANNNNKFYEMKYDGGNTFTVNYGRVELTSIQHSYNYSDWAKKYNEKIKKGYKDVTQFVTEVKNDSDTLTDMNEIKEKKVNDFMNLMKLYRDNLVSKTYSVKSENVTQNQVDEAQRILNVLNSLNDKKDQDKINENLIYLYTLIPRKMKKVQHHILPEINFKETLIQEQDNLDAMSSQISSTKSNISNNDPKRKNILEEIGIEMEECKFPKEINFLEKQITNRIGSIFKVKNSKEEQIFDDWLKNQKNAKTKFLIHGTRCSSVLSILKQGLKIRPTGNYQYSGKAYGEGNYFSEVVSKSLGYTGYDNDKILLVYEVHTGNPFIYDGWYRGNSFNLDYSNLNKRGYDSTYVKAGNGLLNSEIITYNEKQNRIKYIIWLKK